MSFQKSSPLLCVSAYVLCLIFKVLFRLSCTTTFEFFILLSLREMEVSAIVSRLPEVRLGENMSRPDDLQVSPPKLFEWSMRADDGVCSSCNVRYCGDNTPLLITLRPRCLCICCAS